MYFYFLFCVCFSCAAEFYGHALTVGCLPCNCNPQGSVSAVCDSSSGVCSCVTGIMGEKCDECEPRYAVVDGQCQCEWGERTQDVRTEIWHLVLYLHGEFLYKICLMVPSWFLYGTIRQNLCRISCTTSTYNIILGRFIILFFWIIVHQKIQEYFSFC